MRVSSEIKYDLISYSLSYVVSYHEIQSSIYFYLIEMQFFKYSYNVEKRNPISLTEGISDKYELRVVKRKSSVCGAERKVSQQ